MLHPQTPYLALPTQTQLFNAPSYALNKQLHQKITSFVVPNDTSDARTSMVNQALADWWERAVGEAQDRVAGVVRAPAQRDIDGDAFRRQFETAIVDKARFVFSYLWPRIDASPAELQRGADIWNRNSYNKDITAATWLVARTAHALDAIS